MYHIESIRTGYIRRTIWFTTSLGGILPQIYRASSLEPLTTIKYSTDAISNYLT